MSGWVTHASRVLCRLRSAGSHMGPAYRIVGPVSGGGRRWPDGGAEGDAAPAPPLKLLEVAELAAGRDFEGRRWPEKAGAERVSAEENCSGKKAKVTAEVTKITLNVNPKLLECSGCCSPLVPPIFQCANGHITCLKCCADLKQRSCGLCASERTGCHVWGRILGGLTMPCSFKEHGCTETIPFTEKLAHEESCLHAPCHCPIAGSRPYRGRSLRDHINMEHATIQYTRVTASSLSPLSMRNDEPARLVSLGSRAVFLLVVDRSIPSGRALSVIHLVSDPIEKEDFKYKIEVHTRIGILSVSGSKTPSVGRLTTTYQAGASLLVSDIVWSPQDSPVYLELK
ncbi:putative E3 ubiquitin-protein ligase SINA-like 9 [Aegilops tauschii subsp. strangulata]|uniref:putative E3 ubiquitin-protein ligase SINA-like 9 n=1 Tax=Aegilops tauschii subsp. strangulata TaxID=200361 RepID=UPI003CC88E0B